MKPKFSLLPLLLAISMTAISAETPKFQSKYIGQEKRAIKSLSEDDIRQLRQGEGWGLAKAAELNGMPGPAHVLQMKQQIALTEEQEKKITALYDDMKSKAIPLGNDLIKLEKNLNDSFANKSITTEQLNRQLDAIAKVQKKLRYVHLVTHLMTPKILTTQQIETYNRLRGYNSNDPCQHVPEGHDVEMWKMHNNCH